MKKLLLVILILFGCKSVKKNSSNNSSELNIQSNETITRTTEKAIDFNEKRSVDTDIRSVSIGGTKIYPKGRFTVSSDGKFEGEADSVVTQFNQFSETKRAEKDTTSIKGVENESSSKENSNSLDSLQNESSKQVTRKPNLIPYLGLGIVAIGILWFLFLKLKPSKF